MKIKEVCEQTKLSSRTVRLYIEENLISPQYTENYLGRKSYTFSLEDVNKLSNIASLRKYGFSIAEIRQIIATRESSSGIIKDVCNRKAKTIEEETEMLSVLSKLNDGKCYSIEQIAQVLNACHENRDLPKDDTISKYILLLKNPKELCNKILVIADKLLFLASFGFAVFFIVYGFAEWKYPHFSDVSAGLIWLFLISIPALIILSMYIITRIRKKAYMKGLGVISGVVMFLLTLPVTFVGIFTPVESFTTDIKNYGKIDEGMLENPFYDELFPKRPGGGIKEGQGAASSNPEYYYRCAAALDATVDIYAQWGLSEEEFTEEIDRVNKLYAAYKILDGDESYFEYDEIKSGNYTCLIRYNGETPFCEAEDDYYYFIFAYDEDKRIVRYIVCYSDGNGAEQPSYLQLEW